VELVGLGADLAHPTISGKAAINDAGLLIASSLI
jgi:hypothetical protein